MNPKIHTHLEEGTNKTPKTTGSDSFDGFDGNYPKEYTNFAGDGSPAGSLEEGA